MTKELTTTQQLNDLMDNNKVKTMFTNALGDNANIFVASMIELVGNEPTLQKCSPNALMMEALKGAVLNLPISKELGFAYIIAYKGKPAFQIGAHGIVQLALRTGKYKTIHSGTLYEGMIVEQNFLTGSVKISGEKKSDEVLGYFAHFELINGFSKSIFWTKERTIAHAQKYSQAYNSKFSPWQTAPNEMGKKTLLKRLIKKFGLMTTQMSTAFTGEDHKPLSPQGELEEAVTENANTGEIIDLDPCQPENPIEPVQQETQKREPGF